jgi:Uma2 family endonuclease
MPLSIDLKSSLASQGKVLPTMHDLPSEDPSEPGLPDEFHGLQPNLLAEALTLPDYDSNQTFSAFDLNLYYDENHLNWYKRPDWFLVVGVSRLYRGESLRSSYVIWDEKVPPVLIIEFLSPTTEADDLGPFAKKPPIATAGKPPGKFTVYEQILKVPNYIVYNEETQQLRYFQLVKGHYEEQILAVQPPLLWIPELNIGLGLWQGSYRNSPQTWLRWCDAQGHWLLTETERERSGKETANQARDQAQLIAQQAYQAQERAQQLAEQERQVREQAQSDREKMATYLRSLGIDPDNLPPV